MAQDYNKKRVLNAFHKLGFEIVRQSKHIILQDSFFHTIAIPRGHNTVNCLIVRRLLRELSIDIKVFEKLL